MEEFYCKLNKKSSHLIKEPRELPCGNMVCLKCIDNLRDHLKVVQCSFCGKEHKLLNYEIDLKRNILFENKLSQYLMDFASSLNHKNSSLFVDQIREGQSNRMKALENLFQFIEEDIEIRIESVYMEIERTRLSLYNKIDQAKQQVENECLLIEQKQLELKDLIGKFKDESIDFEERKKTLRPILSCDKYFQDCNKRLEAKAQQLMDIDGPDEKDFSSLDKCEIIGVFESPWKSFELTNVLNAKSDFIDFSPYVSNLTSICVSPDNQKIFILDNYLTSIVLFDRSFKFIKSVCLNDFSGIRQAKLTFNSNLYGIVSTNKWVYVNSLEKDEIIVLDSDLSLIKAIFKPFSNVISQSSLCIDFEVYKDNLYVLNNMSRCVYKMNEQGTILSEVKLENSFKRYKQKIKDLIEKYKTKTSFEENLLELYESIDENLQVQSNSFAISDDLIAFSMPTLNEIHIHSLNDGIIFDVIETKSSNLSMAMQMSVCFVDSQHLVSYCHFNGLIQVYKRDDFRTSNNDEQEDEKERSRFNLIFSKSFKNLASKNEKYCNVLNHHKSVYHIKNSVAILFSQENLIAFINC